jgi:hypothetical protein
MFLLPFLFNRVGSMNKEKKWSTIVRKDLSQKGCCYITVDFAMAVSQNQFGKNQKAIFLLL